MAKNNLNKNPMRNVKKSKKNKEQGEHKPKKTQSVEQCPKPDYEELTRSTPQEIVEVERTYWEDAIVLSELLGPPVCKRRKRRRLSYR